MVAEKDFILLGGEITAEDKQSETFANYMPRYGFLKFISIDKEHKVHILEERFFKEPVK
jgi:hypothetical protein